MQGRVFILLGQTKDILNTLKRWNNIHSSHKASLKTLWPLNLNDPTIRDDATALKRHLKTHPENIRCYERVTSEQPPLGSCTEPETHMTLIYLLL